jgi:hypothetical protein
MGTSSPSSPAAPWIRVTSSASSKSGGGRIPWSRRASIVFPQPGAPRSSSAWPPAAATSSARLARSWPRTSWRSGQRGGDTGGAQRAGSRAAPPRRCSTTRRRSGAVHTSRPGARATTMRRQPASRAARQRASAPRTGRRRPSRASSPTSPRPSRPSGPTAPEALRMPMAMGRSRLAPLLRISAGARLTVTRRSGKGRSVPAMAARTRAALSRTAASGRPTRSTRGRSELIRTSTSTATPSTPSSAAPRTRDTVPLGGTGRGEGPKGEGRTPPERSPALHFRKAPPGRDFQSRSGRRGSDVAHEIRYSRKKVPFPWGGPVQRRKR